MSRGVLLERSVAVLMAAVLSLATIPPVPWSFTSNRRVSVARAAMERTALSARLSSAFRSAENRRTAAAVCAGAAVVGGIAVLRAHPEFWKEILVAAPVAGVLLGSRAKQQDIDAVERARWILEEAARASIPPPLSLQDIFKHEKLLAVQKRWISGFADQMLAFLNLPALTPSMLMQCGVSDGIATAVYAQKESSFAGPERAVDGSSRVSFIRSYKPALRKNATVFLSLQDVNDALRSRGAPQDKINANLWAPLINAALNGTLATFFVAPAVNVDPKALPDIRLLTQDALLFAALSLDNHVTGPIRASGRRFDTWEEFRTAFPDAFNRIAKVYPTRKKAVDRLPSVDPHVSDRAFRLLSTMDKEDIIDLMRTDRTDWQSGARIVPVILRGLKRPLNRYVTLSDIYFYRAQSGLSNQEYVKLVSLLYAEVPRRFDLVPAAPPVGSAGSVAPAPTSTPEAVVPSLAAELIAEIRTQFKNPRDRLMFVQTLVSNPERLVRHGDRGLAFAQQNGGSAYTLTAPGVPGRLATPNQFEEVFGDIDENVREVVTAVQQALTKESGFLLATIKVYAFIGTLGVWMLAPGAAHVWHRLAQTALFTSLWIGTHWSLVFYQAYRHHQYLKMQKPPADVTRELSDYVQQYDALGGDWRAANRVFSRPGISLEESLDILKPRSNLESWVLRRMWDLDGLARQFAAFQGALGSTGQLLWWSMQSVLFWATIGLLLMTLGLQYPFGESVIQLTLTYLLGFFGWVAWSTKSEHLLVRLARRALAIGVVAALLQLWHVNVQSMEKIFHRLVDPSGVVRPGGAVFRAV